jgi:hypothetical protein
MSLPVVIKDGDGITGAQAKVTSRGQLVVAPLAFSTPQFNEMTATATAYNFFTPKTSQQFIITEIIISTNKNVSVTDGALIEIFTTNAINSATPLDDILTVQLTKNANLPLTGLNIVTDCGVWINAVTDDATVFLTVSGYYVGTAE